MSFSTAQWNEISKSHREFSPSLQVAVPGVTLTDAVDSPTPSGSRKGSRKGGSKGKSAARKLGGSKAKKRSKASGSIALVSGTMLEDLSSGVTEGPADPSVVGPGREVESSHGPPGNDGTPSLSVAQYALSMCLTKTSRTEALQRLDTSNTSLERSERPRVGLHGTGGLS